MILLFSISGCYEAKDIITCAASNEWSCPKDEIIINEEGVNRYIVLGCNHNIVLQCKGPADGCVYENGSRSLNTRKCIP